MSINSPGDYLVHNPTGRYSADPCPQASVQRSTSRLRAVSTKPVSTKSRGLRWKLSVIGCVAALMLIILVLGWLLVGLGRS